MSDLTGRNAAMRNSARRMDAEREANEEPGGGFGLSLPTLGDLLGL